MQNREDLIHENTELRARLELAERWMRREVASSISKIQKDRLTRRTRSHVQGVWKEEGIDIMTERIMTEFSGVLDHSPKYTLERLIDAEIYWHTLQQYPQMDALPVVIAYQKIIDAWIEESLIAPWRQSMRNTQYELQYSKLDTDIASIIEKRYTLSIGRWYQILSCIRTGSGDDGYMGLLVAFWKTSFPDLFLYMISDEFFKSFDMLVSREIWSKKRHEKKVTFTDARVLRESFIGDDAIFKKLLSF